VLYNAFLSIGHLKRAHSLVHLSTPHVIHVPWTHPTQHPDCISIGSAVLHSSRQNHYTSQSALKRD